jgi:UDP-glucose 4-epimerase
MKILITGASGFIGRHLITVLAKDHKIRTFGRTELESKDFEFVKGNIRDFDSIKKALEGIDEVIHLGAITAGKETLLTMDTNVKGTYNLIEAAVQEKVRRIIFASSIAAYGCLSENFVPEYLPIDEKHPCIPEDMYGLSKFLGEEILKCYVRKGDITTISLRLSWVQPLQKPKSLHSVSKVTLWSTVDVSDVVRAIVLCLESNIKGNEIFNIATENAWTKEDSVDLIKKYYSKVRIAENYFSENPNAGFFDISNARQILGFKPQYELRNVARNYGRY